MKMPVPRSVTTSRRRSGATCTPLGQDEVVAAVAQVGGTIVPTSVLVWVLMTSTPWFTRSAMYIIDRFGSKLMRSKLAVVAPAVVQLGIGMCPTGVKPALGALTFVA